MQKLVRRLVYQADEFLGIRLAGEQGDFSAIADAKGGGDLFVEFERDVLLCEEIDQPVVVLAHFAGDACSNSGRSAPSVCATSNT